MLKKMMYTLKLRVAQLLVTWKFKFKIFKLKRKHKKVLKCDLETIKLCLYNMNKIGLSLNEKENEAIKYLLDMYDKTIKEINGDVDKYRSYIW